MYNLLITALDDAWDEDTFQLDRSRFLEYTNETIEKKLHSLQDEQIAFIKSLPTIFAYEGKEHPYRLGKITEIIAVGKKITIKFNISKKYDPIEFEKIDQIREKLDIRDWEINRTHWAIKDINLLATLKNENIIISDAETNKSISSPPIKKSTASQVTTVSGFIKLVFDDYTNNSTEIFYRGHSNRSKYKLEPSLFRKDTNGNYLYLNDEHIIFKELIIQNPDEFRTDFTTLDKLVRMQHYSLPTRLLDITSNPLIALYFACKSNEEQDGEIIRFSIKTEKIKYFDSDTASCIANLVHLPKIEKEQINFKSTQFNEQLPIKRLIHFISQEKPYFEPKINPDDLTKILCIKSKKDNNRISSQSGAFLLFGHDSTLNEDGDSDIEIKRYIIKNKDNILAELDILNINDSTVFPYIENSAKYITKKYTFKPE